MDINDDLIKNIKLINIKIYINYLNLNDDLIINKSNFYINKDLYIEVKSGAGGVKNAFRKNEHIHYILFSRGGRTFRTRAVELEISHFSFSFSF